MLRTGRRLRTNPFQLPQLGFGLPTTTTGASHTLTSSVKVIAAPSQSLNWAAVFGGGSLAVSHGCVGRSLHSSRTLWKDEHGGREDDAVGAPSNGFRSQQRLDAAKVANSISDQVAGRRILLCMDKEKEKPNKFLAPSDNSPLRVIALDVGVSDTLLENVVIRQDPPTENGRVENVLDSLTRAFASHSAQVLVGYCQYTPDEQRQEGQTDWTFGYSYDPLWSLFTPHDGIVAMALHSTKEQDGKATSVPENLLVRPLEVTPFQVVASDAPEVIDREEDYVAVPVSLISRVFVSLEKSSGQARLGLTIQSNPGESGDLVLLNVITDLVSEGASEEDLEQESYLSRAVYQLDVLVRTAAHLCQALRQAGLAPSLALPKECLEKSNPWVQQRHSVLLGALSEQARREE